MLKTGISLYNYGYGLSMPQAVKMTKEAGFDTFFTGWDPHTPMENYVAIADEAAKNGLIYESIHAPFCGVDCMWSHSPAEEKFISRLHACIDTAAACGVQYVTVHALNAPEWNPSSPVIWSDIGVDNFTEIVAYGATKNVLIAFENVEFPDDQLKRLLEILRQRVPNALRFIWDVGHEHCYYPNKPECVTDMFGDLLIGTHIHDNFGQKNPAMVTWHDDVHILPFDGTLDYRVVASRLKKWNYTGTLTLELGRSPRQWRLLPWYQTYTAEEFFQVAHDRAMQIAGLYENADTLFDVK